MWHSQEIWAVPAARRNAIAQMTKNNEKQGETKEKHSLHRSPRCCLLLGPPSIIEPPRWKKNPEEEPCFLPLSIPACREGTKCCRGKEKPDGRRRRGRGGRNKRAGSGGSGGGNEKRGRGEKGWRQRTESTFSLFLLPPVMFVRTLSGERMSGWVGAWGVFAQTDMFKHFCPFPFLSL